MADSNLLTERLDQAGVAYELLEHNPTDRAAEEATALGLRLNEVAKTIVVTAREGNLRVLLPASERIDMHKLRDLLGAGKELHLLTEEALGAEYPEFDLGAVPPVGGREDGVVVDRRVADLDQVVFEAGSHDRSSDLGEEPVAGLVAQGVVDGLEVVEVEHDQAERRALLDDPLEPLLERGVVEETGQAIGARADLDRLEHLRVVERDRHLRRKQLDQLELVEREGVADTEPLDREHADRAATAAQRDDDQAAFVRAVVAMVDSWVVAFVHRSRSKSYNQVSLSPICESVSPPNKTARSRSAS